MKCTQNVSEGSESVRHPRLVKKRKAPSGQDLEKDDVQKGDVSNEQDLESVIRS